MNSVIGDLVVVNLSGLPETIPPHEERIKEDGTITLPYIGAVKAAEKTPGELQNEIHDLYVPKIYSHLTVTVTIAGARLLRGWGSQTAWSSSLHGGNHRD